MSLAPNTERAYDRAFKEWESYATDEAIPSLPITPIDLGNFVARVADETGSMSKVNLLIAAVTDRHLAEYLKPPTQDPSFRKMMAGVRRALFRPARQRAPLDKEILKDAFDLIEGGGRLQDWRTLCRMNIEFYGMLRWSEVSELRMEDIKFTNSGMIIYIKRSKTDQVGSGDYVRINMIEEDHCPVEITRLYIYKLNYGTENGYLQPQIRSYKDGTQAGVWHKKLGYSTALEDLKSYMAMIGRDPANYGEHSGRRGGATTASEAGVSWLDLKRHGRWASDSSAQRYVDETQKKAGTVPAALAKATSTAEETGAFIDLRKRQRNAEVASGKAKSGTATTASEAGPSVKRRATSPPPGGNKSSTRAATVKVVKQAGQSVQAALGTGVRQGRPEAIVRPREEAGTQGQAVNPPSKRSLLPTFARMPAYASEFSRVPIFTTARMLMPQPVTGSQWQDGRAGKRKVLVAHRRAVTQPDEIGKLSPDTLKKLFDEDAFNP